jgi:TonB-dependent SusC/RagA subfamily outer membrane receptor
MTIESSAPPVYPAETNNGITIDPWQVMMALYIIGISVILIKNLISYLNLSLLMKKGVKTKHQNYNLIENVSIKSPFSFLNYIFIGTNELSNTEKEVIIKHESTHINQKHWIDLLCSECMLMLQWFNPFVWIYVRLLKENHEFLADKAVVDSGVSPAVYQAVLINQEFKGPVFSFANSFNYSKPLNRLIMIKKEKSASWKRLTALLIIPAFAAYIWASAEPRYVVEYVDYSIQEDSIQEKSYFYFEIGDSIPEGETTTYEIELTSEDGNMTLSAESITINRIPVVLPVGFSPATSDDIKTNIGKNEPVIIDSGEYTICQDDGNPHFYLSMAKAKVMKSEKPTDSLKISFSTPRLELITDSVKPKGRIGKVKVDTIKDGSERRFWVRGTKAEPISGDTKKQVKVIYMNGNKVDSISDQSESTFWIRSVKKFGESGSPVFYVDGEKVDNIDNLNVEDIESLSVLKDASATAIYGEEGKNGVVLVTSKKNSLKQHQSKKDDNAKQKSEFWIRGLSNNENALVLIDGKEGKLEDVAVEDIESISILKDASAIAVYGEEGKNGVILITTKSASNNESKKEVSFHSVTDNKRILLHPLKS